MGIPTNAALPLARSEPRTRIASLLESIALHHQIAVLERNGTRRPCFSLWDRPWILLSRWWPQWRDSLIIIQPETILRWRREGWSLLWQYRARDRWRGGRPRVSNELRHLIVRLPRENFLSGAPRIHNELLVLGFSVSQTTVPCYLANAGRRPGQ
jgi:putative transposase